MHLQSAIDVVAQGSATSSGPFLEQRVADFALAVAEAQALLEAYRGTERLCAARWFFDQNDSGNWVEVVFPPEAVDRFGESGFMFSYSEIYSALAADCTEQESAVFYAKLADFYESTEPRPACFSAREVARDLQVAIRANPSLPVDNIEQWYRETAFMHGVYDAAPGISLDYPDEIAAPIKYDAEWDCHHQARGEAFRTHWLMHEVAPTIATLSAERREALKALADFCFIDEMYYDYSFETSDGEKIDISNPKFVSQDHLSLMYEGRRIPGSVKLVSYGDGSSLTYSASDDEHEFAVYVLPEDDDEGLRYLLVGATRVLLSYCES